MADVWKSPELAKTYLKGIRSAIPRANEQIDTMVRVVRASRERVERVLDLGCGNGLLGASLLQAFPAARGVFVDFSDAMLTAAAEAMHDVGERVVLTKADLREPQWVESIRDDAPYDAIVSGFAIHHLPDERKRALYAEVHELLSPGAAFVHIEHVSSPTAWVTELFDSLFIDALFAWHSAQPSGKTRDEIAREYYYRPDKAANILAPVETQCEWLREIGYQDVDCYMKVFEIAVFGGRRADTGRR